jgi:hypothetical protein
VSQSGWRQSTPNLDSQSARAAELDRELNLISSNDSFQNWGGEDERWLHGGGDSWYYITPVGNFFLWDGISGSTFGTDLNGTFIESFSTIYYETTQLLSDPISPDFIATSGSNTTDQDFGNFQPATVSGRVFEDENRNGIREAGERYLNGWRIELLDESGRLITTTSTVDLDLDGDGQINPDTEKGWYTFAGLRPATYTVQQVFIANWEQSTPGFGPEADTIYRLDQELGLFATENQFQNWGHLNELWLLGQSFDPNDRDGEWYYLTPNGNLYQWDEDSGGTQGEVSGTLIANIDDFYYRNLEALHTAKDPQFAIGSGQTISDKDFGDFSPLDQAFGPSALGRLLD